MKKFITWLRIVVGLVGVLPVVAFTVAVGVGVAYWAMFGTFPGILGFAIGVSLMAGTAIYFIERRV